MFELCEVAAAAMAFHSHNFSGVWVIGYGFVHKIPKLMGGEGRRVMRDQLIFIEI